jgi:hypothetical protein
MIRQWLISLIFLAGCASGAADGPAVVSRNVTTIAPQETIDLTHQSMVSATAFSGSRAQVWSAVLKAHETLGLPVVSIDEKAGIARYQVVSRTGSIAGRPAGNLVDCGLGSAGPRVTTHRVTMSVTETLATDDTGNTRVLTVVDAIARSPGMSADALPCNSTGKLEKEIVALIAAQLN